MKLRGNEFVIIPMNAIVKIPELGEDRRFRLLEDVKVCTNAQPVVIEVDEDGEPIQ